MSDFVRGPHFPHLSTILLLPVVLLAGCGNQQLDSPVLDREITVDGIGDDWSEAWVWLDDAAVAAGSFHDDEYLYLFMRSRNRQVNRQVMTGGLEMKFRPSGGGSDSLSIRFPMGFDPSEMRGRPPQDERRERGERGDRGDREPPRPSFDRLSIKRAEDPDWLLFEVSEYTGIEAAASLEHEVFVCELKVPLAAGEATPYALETASGGVLHLAVESRRPDMGEMREKMGGRGGMGGPGGGMGGPGGGMGGPGGGMGGPGGMGRGPDMGESLKLHAKIVLVD